MIDTVRISIYREFNQNVYDFLLINTNQNMNGYILNSRTNDVINTNLWSYRSIQYKEHECIMVNGYLKVPSSEYDINYRVFEDRIDIEFSLPKFIYGTNNILLMSHLTRNKKPYDLMILALHKFFNWAFPTCKVDLGGVELRRWDYCFNQVFVSEEESLRALKYIKLKVASKMDKLSYDTGIVELSKTKYFKIYHKGSEFMKNDFYKFKYADNFVNMSSCILRYEKKITPKNLAYWYNTKVKYKNQPLLVKEYIKLKNSGKRMNKYLRSEMENVQRFTLGNSKILKSTKLDAKIFNYLYEKFENEIKRKYDIGRMSIDELKSEVINNKKNKVIKLKILAYIKVFKSLKRAYESGAITKPTYYRYVKLVNDLGISQTNVKSEIVQDWTYQSYYSKLSSQGISPLYYSKDTNF